MATTVDVSDLLADVQIEARRIAAAAAERVVEMAKADAPVSPATPTNLSPGRLRDSLTVFETESREEGPSIIMVVGSDVEYAQYTDEVDTDPHEIRARRAPMLRFWWEDGFAGPGIYHFLRVNHPGTKGQRWFESQNQARWDQALQETA